MEYNKWLSKPVKKGSVSKLVLNRIKDALINRELKPGDYLPSETELVKSLGVGKSSVREAIKMLEAMGIVEVKRGQGTIIREQPDTDNVNSLLFQLIVQQGNVQDILDLRGMFEIAYTVMAMTRVTSEDKKKIEKTIIDFERNIKQGTQTVQGDMAFHLAILYSTHNPYVIRIGEAIIQLFRASIRKSVQQTPEWALDDHKRIFKALCKKNEEQVRKIILDTLDRWKQNLV